MDAIEIIYAMYYDLSQKEQYQALAPYICTYFLIIYFFIDYVFI